MGSVAFKILFGYTLLGALLDWIMGKKRVPQFLIQIEPSMWRGNTVDSFQWGSQWERRA